MKLSGVSVLGKRDSRRVLIDGGVLFQGCCLEGGGWGGDGCMESVQSVS